jgi:hypothetical protein
MAAGAAVLVYRVSQVWPNVVYIDWLADNRESPGSISRSGSCLCILISTVNRHTNVLVVIQKTKGKTGHWPDITGWWGT